MCKETDASPQAQKAPISKSGAPSPQHAQQAAPARQPRKSNGRYSSAIPEEVKIEVSSYLPPLEESVDPELELDLDLSSVEVSATE